MVDCFADSTLVAMVAAELVYPFCHLVLLSLTTNDEKIG